VLLEAVNEYKNPQDEEAQLLEAKVEDIIPEPVVEGSEKSSLAETVGQKFEAIEEDYEEETSSRAWWETLRSQSSLPSLQHINASFDNTGSGVMINRNIGNMYNATITNVGNNNSVNHYRR
jgi:hypothetical protein